MPALASSISGYCTEIGSPHPRQRARRISQESTGILSYHASPRPQRGQRDRGWTTDCFGSAPQRRMHTFRKLPIIAPKSAATTISNPSGSSASTSDLVQEDAGSNRHVERLDTAG